MITYTSRKECLAAIKEQGLDAKPYGIRVDGEDRYEIKLNEAQPVKAKATKGKPAPAAKAVKAVIVATEDGPCAIVRKYVQANPTVERTEAIAALVAMGVHKATASIQYKKAHDRLAA